MIKRSLTIFLTGVILITMIPLVAYADDTPSFSDMPVNWSTTALKSAVANGLLVGDNGKIMANESLTRAQMAAVINRVFGAIETVPLTGFKDIPTNAWYHNEMAKAVQMKTFVGTGDGLLHPDRSITREEAFAVIARAFRIQRLATENLIDFTDIEMVSTWAYTEVAALAAAGYINGNEGRLDPKSNITRAEFAQIMDNLIKQYIKIPGTYTNVANGNVMVNVSGVTLKDMEIKGDLIIGDGVGDGEVTLDNVKVVGRMVVRGGGENSIIIKGGSDIQTIIIARINGQLRVFAEDGTEIGQVIIDGYDGVTIEGDVGEVQILANSISFNLINSSIPKVFISGENMVLNVGDNASVESINVIGNGTRIEGSGSVSKVQVNANNVSVSTTGTEVIAALGTSNVLAGDTLVTPGTTITIVVEEISLGGGGTIIKDYSTPESHFIFDLSTGTITKYIGTGLEIIIPETINGVTVVNIGDDSFRGQDIKSVKVPSNVETIGQAAFAECPDLASFIFDSGSELQSIASSAFMDCISLERITIPSMVVDIGVWPLFSGCVSLTSIDVDINNMAFSSIDGVLFNKEKTRLITFPEGKSGSYEIPNGVTTIDALAFINCNSFTSVLIPDSVESIDENIFSVCKSLQNISVSLTNSIFSSVDGVLFNKDSTLLLIYPNAKGGHYEIQEGVLGLGVYAFSGCNLLTSISIPSSVTSNSMTMSFTGCSSLNSINVHESNPLYSSLDGVLLNKDQTTLITVPNGRSGQYNIPNGVLTIGQNAFSNCSLVTSVSIPESVTFGYWSIFMGCNTLTNIYVDEQNELYSSIDGVLFNKDGTLLVCYPEGRNGSYEIPSGTHVVGEWAFAYCEGLTGINMPDSLVGINMGAFERCTSLQGGLEIPSGVTAIGDRAFYYCGLLESVIFPTDGALESLGYGVFMNCENIGQITIGSDVAIGDYMLNEIQDFNNNFRDAYMNVLTGGAGTYSGTYNGTWSKLDE